VAAKGFADEEDEAVVAGAANLDAPLLSATGFADEEDEAVVAGAADLDAPLLSWIDA